MSVKRKKYSKQFKLDAIQMYENGEKSMAQVERELGITVWPACEMAG
jgi:transposase-like protein